MFLIWRGERRWRYYGVVLAHVAVDEEGRLLVELVDVAIEHALDVEGVDREGV